MVIENYMDPGALIHLPDHVRTDLVKCAASNGRISLEYLVAFATLPLGPHGRRENPDVETGHVRAMVRYLQIRGCAERELDLS